MKWPIVGDNIYGTAPRSGGPRLQLHAREVAVPLYKNREPIKVDCAGAGAYARAAEGVRVEWGGCCRGNAVSQPASCRGASVAPQDEGGSIRRRLDALQRQLVVLGPASLPSMISASLPPTLRGP